MHDIREIRDAPEAFDAALATRGLPPASAGFLELDDKRRKIQTDLQERLNRRNELSREVGQIKKSGGDASAEMAEVARIKEDVAALEDDERSAVQNLNDALSALPNLPMADVPNGADENDNVEVRQHLKPPSHNFESKQHFELGELHKLMDFEAAAKLSGSRFVVLKGAIARLERALANFMLDIHTTEFGYTETQPPLLVRDAAAYGTGQLPKLGEDMFRTENGFWLIPTSEVPLTSLVMDSIVDAHELPLRFTAYTPCFRSEAGAAGRDTRGMLRQHQFGKVEMVSIVHPDKSVEEHERMTACAEEILKRLGLAFRTMLLCSGDMGFSARKTYDLEVWLPGQKAYREISSCSNCWDFQARRMKARFKVPGEKGTHFLHTLNGSGVATGRALIAVIENYQQQDGSIAIPDALQPYMGGLESIQIS